MHCSNCGNENPENASFCQQCGQQINATAGAVPGAISTQQSTSGFAVASLVLGITGFIIGWFTFFISALPAVIFGHLARGRIKRANGTIAGNGMAIAGLILGYMQLALFGIAILGVVVALTVPAYQDYTLRSRVSEAGSLSAASRTAIDVAVSEGYRLGTIPTQPEKIGLAKPYEYQSKYVESVSYNAYGLVTVRLKNNKTLGIATGKIIIFAPRADGKNLIWSVHKDSTVQRRYWPRP